MLRQNLDYDYSKLPKSTIFEVDYIEDGFASCLDTSQKHSEKYCIPSELLDESAKKLIIFNLMVLNILLFLILTKKILTNFNKKIRTYIKYAPILLQLVMFQNNLVLF